MSLDRQVILFAGAMTLISLALTQWVSPYFIWLTVFIGLNQVQSAFTGICPAALMFKVFGAKKGCAFN